MYSNACPLGGYCYVLAIALSPSPNSCTQIKRIVQVTTADCSKYLIAWTLK